MTTRKVALVTGSNKGIGLSVVRALCKKLDGDVLLCSRDEKRGEEAIAQLESEGLKPKLVLLDITDTASVARTRELLVKEYGGLDVLVNNAAVGYTPPFEKPEIELAKETLDTNYFATASVCDILFPILKPGARVVNVGSSTGLLTVFPDGEKRQFLSSSTLRREDIDSMAHEFLRDMEKGKLEENGWPSIWYAPYAVTKTLLAALTWIQHREFQTNEEKDIVINVVHPGYVDTDMTRHSGVLSVDEGAEPIVRCCLIPPAGSPRGQMIWWDGRVVNWFSDVIHIMDAPGKSKNPLPYEI